MNKQPAIIAIILILVGLTLPTFAAEPHAVEFIYGNDDRPTPQCHASTIEETPVGLVAAWFGGTHEKNKDVGIWVSRHIDGNWTKPIEVADGIQSDKLRHPCWNPVLFRTQDGVLQLYYKVGPTPQSWWGMLISSKDHGKTWSPPRKLGHDKKIGHLIGPVKNKPVQLDDGTLLCPSSTEHDGWRVHFEKSSDGGKTWKVIGPIHDASRFNAIQPSILFLKDGRLQVMCRTQESVVGQAFSSDLGDSWTTISASDLPNPNSGTDALTLADGRHLLVYNHTTRKKGNRSMLNVALSSDGKEWQMVHTLEHDEGEYSYPAVIQTNDGMIHITYTYRRRTVKHVTLNPKSLDPSIQE